jgi:hypothetical protein
MKSRTGICYDKIASHVHSEYDRSYRQRAFVCNRVLRKWEVSTTMNTGEATISRAGDATFLGHPKGLFYLAFTEA